MAGLTINTNISSLIASRNLLNATNSISKSLERMTTGFKLNHASDNAAGYSIASMWNIQISTLDIAANNASIASDLLTTAEENYNLINSHLTRIRDLTEQAANGTYATASLRAIQIEIAERLKEINRTASISEFNGIKLMTYIDDETTKNIGITSRGIDLQVGLYASKDSVINLDASLFKSAKISSLFSGGSITINSTAEDGSVTAKTYSLDDILKSAGGSVQDLTNNDGLKALAAAMSGLRYVKSEDGKENYYRLSDVTFDYGASEMLTFIDKAISEISRRTTNLGAYQNRVSSALSAIEVQSQGLISSLSTIRDADISVESSKYIQAQILQQAAATLLATANQTPSIALNLL